MKNTASILGLYAVTPCHVGSGVSLGVVDLPIQRERHTNWPVIQASGVKGALRAHFERFKGNIKEVEQFERITELVFGADTKNGDFAGSLSVGDAKILAFPMRSNIAPFVWITCPAVLKRLNRDLKLASDDTKPADGETMQQKTLQALDGLTLEEARWINNTPSSKDTDILLEDMQVTVTRKELLPLDGKAGKLLASAACLLLVHDKVFDYGVSNCTQIMAQIMINQATGTTKTGSLRYQEELPADTLMYTTIFWGDSRDGRGEDGKPCLSAATIRQYIQDDVVAGHIQIGGDETLGRGLFEVTWI